MDALDQTRLQRFELSRIGPILRMHTKPLAIPARNDVYVYVVDRLPSRSTIELYNLHAVRLELVQDDARKLLHSRHHRSKDCRLDIKNISSLALFWNNKDVTKRLRKNIQKGQHIGIFVNFVGRRFAAKDKRKDVLRIVVAVEAHDHSL